MELIKCFDQLSGERSTWKLVEIHNTHPLGFAIDIDLVNVSILSEIIFTPSKKEFFFSIGKKQSFWDGVYRVSVSKTPGSMIKQIRILM